MVRPPYRDRVELLLFQRLEQTLLTSASEPWIKHGCHFMAARQTPPRVNVATPAVLSYQSQRMTRPLLNDQRLATAADYADALLIARAAKNWLYWLLLVLLLLQLAVFFLFHYDVLQPPGTISVRAAASMPATAPMFRTSLGFAFAEYLTGAIGFLGIVLVLVLAMVLFLITVIMLVGRLLGVARLTSAFIWTLLLALLLFPWQAFLADYAFKIPGVIYTWNDLLLGGHWRDLTWQEALLKWARWVAFPVVAIVVLMAVQVKSVRGLRQALGEAEPERDFSSGGRS
jgi:hypothetical protein